jgi:predicted nucleic acid-binding Zn ribbon protein
MTRTPEQGSEHRKRQRGKNLALLAALAGFVVLVYVVSLVRMGGS